MRAFFLVFLLVLIKPGLAQLVTASFSGPDTVCVNSTVQYQNTSANASNYYWSFCEANFSAPPAALNLGNPNNQLAMPVWTDLVKDEFGNFYAFVTNNFPGGLVKLSYGNSMLNTPVAQNLGNFGGIIPQSAEGLQVIKANGTWTVVMVGGNPPGNSPSRIVKIDLGASLATPTPVATDWGNIGALNYPHDLIIFSENNQWYGYTINALSNSITRFSFGANFSAAPTAVNMGNLGNLNIPVGLGIIKSGNNWHLFAANGGNSTLTRLDFGTSLLNTPTAVNIGNPGNGLSNPRDISFIQLCTGIEAITVNANSNSITKLSFGNSITATPTSTTLGNLGGLNFPHGISELFREGSDIYAFVPNVNTNSMTRLRFAGCAGTPASSELQTPPPVTYNQSGTFYISLMVDLGLPTQNFFCKKIEVLATPMLNGRADTTVCRGAAISMNMTATSATGFSWSPAAGLSSSTIVSPIATPQTSTQYILTATNRGYCESKDTVNINVSLCNTISNIINTYTPVTGFLPCENKITVQDASTFNTGDTVLIIQMKGAVIDSTNTAGFGNITNYKNAGNYEFNYVKQKAGNVIELKNLVTRGYDIPDGKVQLVRVPYYRNTVVTSTLTCLPWDGTTGGVLVFNVQDSLELGANIDVSGRGFMGGIDPVTNPPGYNCYENNFYYPVSPDLASGKGEGIASISTARSFGKGALANGGGGGNSHNSGGGGGSNAAAGGFGGYSFEGTPCNAGVPFDNRGIGGKLLPYTNATNKIFMGGGGGAGHTNNPQGFEAKGGNGAGIIIIVADKLKSNGRKIMANGSDAAACPGGGAGCHEGMGGGGAGGTTLLKINTYLDIAANELKGGKGGDMTTSGSLRLGPGGGGGGGTLWLSHATLPTGLTVTNAGGQNGTCTAYSNSWGATAGAAGATITGLVLPLDNTAFKPNIDSVRIKDSLTGCSSFDFKGLSFINNAPITSWQWSFGDGGNATTQNTSHNYPLAGNYTIKLVVTDANGCKDSVTKNITVSGNAPDFSYSQDKCDPLVVNFFGSGTLQQAPYWNFGNGNTNTGSLTPQQTYSALGTYVIKYVLTNGLCKDTITKSVTLSLLPDNIIKNPDTTICAGGSVQMRTDSGSIYCWTPTTYLDNPLLANPLAKPLQSMTYYMTSRILGNNLVVNGNFSGGNTGFISAYQYTSNGFNPGTYFVGTNLSAWHPAAPNCGDHTTGNGAMMMVNGAQTSGVNVWTQTITVVPNTSYEFSCWLQHVTTINPARLQFAIDGVNIGNIFQANSTSCIWDRFNSTWNSGNKTSVTISIVNMNTVFSGNDFALDDISFAPYIYKFDSVKINIDTPRIRTNDSISVCAGTPVQLTTTGGTSYTWSPAGGLSNPNIGNPVATVTSTTSFIVTGTNANRCSAKDTVVITAMQLPIPSLTNDTSICRNGSLQLVASGGTSYQWSPATGLSNPGIANPVATPAGPVKYKVVITGANGCPATDSVSIGIKPAAVFGVNPPPPPSCTGQNVQLGAFGGDTYTWTPANGLNNPAIANPVASLQTSQTYTVTVRESVCNEQAVFTVPVIVGQAAAVTVRSSNIITCNVPTTQLTATGGSVYEWTPASGLSNPNSANPVAAPDTTTMYTVHVSTLDGCTGTDSVEVKVVKSGDFQLFQLPNAFTPNGDGLNDCFGVRKWGRVNIIYFEIFNRWGQRVFNGSNSNNCWDGNVKGVPEQSSNFVYKIKVETICGVVQRHGNVVLIR